VAGWEQAVGARTGGPSCSNLLGNILIDRKTFITSLQFLSDQAPDDHKNKGVWNMLLGKDYDEELGDRDKTEASFPFAGAAGCPEGYTKIGNFYFKKEDWSNARRYYLLAVNPTSPNTKPDAEAMYNLGIMHRLRHCKKETSLEWFTKSADQGHVPACSKIGYMYMDGEDGVAQDKKRAVKWFCRGAEGDDTDSMWQRARRYRDGDGTKRDYPLAKKWYQKAAEAGRRCGQHVASIWDNCISMVGEYNETRTKPSTGFKKLPVMVEMFHHSKTLT